MAKDTTAKELAKVVSDAAKLILSTAETAATKLVTAADLSTVRIATATEIALKVVEAAKAENLRVNNSNPSVTSDREAFIRLESAVANSDKNSSEKFADLKADISKLSDNTTSKIAEHDVKIEGLLRWQAGIGDDVKQIKINSDDIVLIRGWKSNIILTVILYGSIGAFLAIVLLNHVMTK